MKIMNLGSVSVALIVATIGLIAATGCRSSDQAKCAGSVDSHSYLIVGEVRRPGVIFSGDSPQTLLSLIDSRGGFTDYAIWTKVQVIYSGTTNRHNCKSIRNGKLPDPLIHLGARIVVRRAVP